MKIHVIDNTGRMQPQLLMTEADVTFFNDEILALNAVEKQLPGLILLNFALRGEETANYVEMLISQCPTTKIVVVGNELSDEQVLDCLVAGAKGYQNIRDLPQYIEKIIKVIALGEAWITRRMTAYLLDYIRTQNLAMLNNLAGYALSSEAKISH
jgi:DNA-binding NarL/FixJ family response regulator